MGTSPWTWRLLGYLKQVAAVFVAAGALAIAVCLFAVWPFLADDLALDRLVRVVALDWRDFGEDKARERLQYELDHQKIGVQVGDGDCLLEEEIARRVRCDWTAVVVVPVAGTQVPLAFSSRATIGDDGDIW
ncbi:MAG: hypothetical protein GWP91_05290 [Rhodobacterales bacterium]|nr:hypothetical protein [Rhodobacterales bacterium]